MKVVLLAGGFGTRISEESQYKPKPMIEIGGMPILWHIMKEYSYYGHNDFIICAGYKQEYIKEWFANYFIHNSDVTFDYRNGGNEMTIHESHCEPWRVTVVDTGYNTMTGGRIKRVQKYIGDETFFMTYGDGVCDVDINKLLEFHKSHGNKVSFFVAFFLSFGSAFIISRCSAKGIDINPVINVVLVYCDLLLDFILGALLYRYAARKKIQRLRVWQASALLVIIVGLEMLSPTQADDSFYAFFVILLILQFPYQNRLVGAFLANLGRHSMPMWMCHTFLSIYLFPNFIYGFRYPLLIFLVLTALSYAISIVVLKSSAVLENLVGLSTTRSTRK